MEELIGKTIAIVDADTGYEGVNPYFTNGHVAKITMVDSMGDAWADFAGNGNAWVNSIARNAVWCVGKGDRFKVID